MLGRLGRQLCASASWARAKEAGSTRPLLLLLLLLLVCCMADVAGISQAVSAGQRFTRV